MGEQERYKHWLLLGAKMRTYMCEPPAHHVCASTRREADLVSRPHLSKRVMETAEPSGPRIRLLMSIELSSSTLCPSMATISSLT